MPVNVSSTQISQYGVAAVTIAQATNPAATSRPLPTSTLRKPKRFMIRLVAGFMTRLPTNSHSSRVPDCTAV